MFRWPPRTPRLDLVDVASAPEPPTATPRAPSRWVMLGRWLADAERAWAPVVTPPLGERLEAAGWAPDAPDAYCDLCGGTIGPYEQDELGCAACRGQRLRWRQFVRLGAYEGVLAECIQEVKFGAWSALGVRLGELLGQRARELGGPARPAVVPVPMTRWRRAARGVDHTGAMARGVARALDGRVVLALSRRPGPSQRDVPVSARAANVRGVFRAAPLAARRLGSRPVVLVDDVCTSGATLRAAARALPRACGRERLWAAVAAVTPAPDRRAGGSVDPRAGQGRSPREKV